MADRSRWSGKLVTLAIVVILASVGLVAFNATDAKDSSQGRENGRKATSNHRGRTASGDNNHRTGSEGDYRVAQFHQAVTGTADGLAFDFKAPELAGTLVYGLINPDDGIFPFPRYQATTVAIKQGKATLPLAETLGGPQDTIKWQEYARGQVGYRVIRDDGRILYTGKVAFRGKGPFKVPPCIVEGPFVSGITHHSARIEFTTNTPTTATVHVGSNTIESNQQTTHHRVAIENLPSGQAISCSIDTGETAEDCRFITQPPPGTRVPFLFACAGGTRAGRGGGERDVTGVNARMLNKIMARAMSEFAVFVQFCGDLVEGDNNPEALKLQYANWKRTVDPWTAFKPVYTAMGRHETLAREATAGPSEGLSAEAIFNQAFANPTNGPASEDGSAIDPDDKADNFPPYAGTAYWHRWDNVALVVLNTAYWHRGGPAEVIPTHGSEDPDHNASSTGTETASTDTTTENDKASRSEKQGNPEGYLMDKQLTWLKNTLATLDTDKTIDHVLIIQNAPVVPACGRVGSAMWHTGDNSPRPRIGEHTAEQGIIQRRDLYLLTLMQSRKVVAIITGGDPGYYRVRIKKLADLYPQGWTGPRLQQHEAFRPIWQVNCGSGGAPFTGRFTSPWDRYVMRFTTQPAMLLVRVNERDPGEIVIEAINPETLTPIDQFDPR